MFRPYITNEFPKEIQDKLGLDPNRKVWFSKAPEIGQSAIFMDCENQTNFPERTGQRGLVVDITKSPESARLRFEDGFTMNVQGANLYRAGYIVDREVCSLGGTAEYTASKPRAIIRLNDNAAGVFPSTFHA